MMHILFNIYKTVILQRIPLSVLEVFVLFIFFELYSLVSLQLVYFVIVLALLMSWWQAWTEILQDYVNNQALVLIFESCIWSLCLIITSILVFSLFTLFL